MGTSWQDAVIEAVTARPLHGRILMTERGFVLRGWLNFALGVASVLIFQRVRR